MRRVQSAAQRGPLRLVSRNDLWRLLHDDNGPGGQERDLPKLRSASGKSEQGTAGAPERAFKEHRAHDHRGPGNWHHRRVLAAVAPLLFAVLEHVIKNVEAVSNASNRELQAGRPNLGFLTLCWSQPMLAGNFDREFDAAKVTG